MIILAAIWQHVWIQWHKSFRQDTAEQFLVISVNFMYFIYFHIFLCILCNLCDFWLYSAFVRRRVINTLLMSNHFIISCLFRSLLSVLRNFHFFYIYAFFDKFKFRWKILLEMVEMLVMALCQFISFLPGSEIK